MSFWSHQVRAPAKAVPSPAFRVGQDDFLAGRACRPRAFNHLDLQSEYAAGWLQEYKDVPR